MTNLSPQAQAVWDTFDQDAQEIEAVAAVLRAAADQVVPEYREHYPATLDERYRKVSAFDVRNRLLAIAAELEGSNDR